MLPSRYWAKVDKPADGWCWLWLAHTTEKGYGQLKVAGVARYAHRLSYEDAFGPVPDGLTVHHCCNNPGCVNPDHLVTATRVDNTIWGNRERARKWELPV